jgi:hypothetical protein
MTVRPRVLLASSAVIAGLVGFVFWSAHRRPASTEQRAAIASQSAEPQRPEVAAVASSEPKLPAPLAVSAAASVPTPAAPMSESALMTELRTFKDSDPEFAIERAREGNQRFPDSADAPERSSILIHALAAAGRSSEARGEAEDMVNHYPDSEWVREIERFTGAHRHRNVHIAANGQLAYD